MLRARIKKLEYHTLSVEDLHIMGYGDVWAAVREWERTQRDRRVPEVDRGVRGRLKLIS
jgi:hypothetical protein